MESLLNRGYSSVHTRFGFNTGMFTQKSKEHIEQKNNIEKTRNVRGEPDEEKKKKQKKKLSKELYDLFKKRGFEE